MDLEDLKIDAVRRRNKIVDRYTIFAGCEKVASECTNPFMETKLEQAACLLADELRFYEKRKRRRDIRNDVGDGFKPFRKIRLKTFQLKQKFFHAFFQKFILGRKAAKPYKIIGLCIEYNVKVDVGEKVYITEF